jgi:D-tyrosyl-tRNA(Tyr) deacylase
VKLVLQRVKQAQVSVEGKQVGAIGAGLLVFLCIEKGDDEKLAEHYASKVVDLRIFGDEQGKMNRSLREVAGEVLLISQFTLAADAEKGRRPSFDRAAPPETADRLYRYFTSKLQDLGVTVATGVFQAFMEVALINDGPVTILLGN